MPKKDSLVYLKRIEKEAEKEIKEVVDLESLKLIFDKYLGSEGEIKVIFKNLKKMPKRKKILWGKKANETKRKLEILFKKREEIIKKKKEKDKAEKEGIDVTLPGQKISKGHLHPLTKTKRKVMEIFQSMGFLVIEGPEIENEWYNFDALNIPKEHPARDLWDTLYLKTENSEKKEKFLLRTHTSPVQVRFMEKNQPPFRIIVPGTVYRHEATDATHDFQLLQIEGLMVDRKISVANLKSIIENFLKKFFNKEIKIKLRPDYFPFTEPSFDVSVSCLICNEKRCPGCKNKGWLEVAGAGMVHPQVFKNSGLNPKHWQGWAFGFGLDRLTMMKYKIDDIRLFRSGDLKFLNQF